MPTTSRPPFFELCRAEPFRIFFPLGLLFGISGVSLWPLYFSGLHKFYPGIMHARMMAEGFLGAFVIGFLGTAAPRLTGTNSLSRRELALLLALEVAAVGTHIAERYAVGDALFLSLLLAFGVVMSRRFARRQDLPPPSFVLVTFGFINAIAGTVLLLFSGLGEGFPRCYLLGSQLLYQGFVLYLVLGIGGFLLPRFLELPRPEFPESRTPPPGWRIRAIIALAAGVFLLATFVSEAFVAAPRLISGFRTGLATAFLCSQIPWHRGAIPRLTLTVALRLALVFILFGLLFPALWPAQRVAGEHIVFIGGFTLLTLTVATRVVLGHSGNSGLFRTPLPFLIATAFLLVVSLILRVAGDFALGSRATLLSFASYLWILGAAVWTWHVLPKVPVADSN